MKKEYNNGDFINGLMFIKNEEPLIDKKNRKRFVATFKCKCGDLFICRIDQVVSNNTTSCGCHRLKQLKKAISIQYNYGDSINGIIYIGDVATNKKTREAKFKCPYCNNDFISRISAIKNGHAKSCGCYKSKALVARLVTHGGTGTKEYLSWQHMKARCYMVNNESYPDYGGRGIFVCDEWVNDFSHFLDDMGYMPTPKHTIERKDVNKGYYKDNCKWATKKEQNRNKRNTIYITFNGVKKPLVEWIEGTGLKDKTVRDRLKKGWGIERAFSFKIA